MTPPASGARAARSGRARSRGSRRRAFAHRAGLAVAAIATILVPSILVPLGGPATAAVAATGSVGAAAREASAAGVEFRMAAESNGVLRPDGQLVVATSVTNLSTAVVDAGTIDLAVSRAPLDTRAAVEAWLADDSSPSLRGVGSQDAGTVGPYGTTSVQMQVGIGDDLDPGVYALRGTYRSGDLSLTARGVFVVAGPETPTGAVAVLVPITAGPLTAGLLTEEELATLTAEGGSLRTQLDAVSGTDAILAIDPAIPAAIRVLGTGAPETATQWLADLLRLPNSRFALQFGDADLAVQFGAGLDSPLTVSTLDPYLDLTRLDPSPNVTPDDARDDTDAEGAVQGTPETPESPDPDGSTPQNTPSPTPTPTPTPTPPPANDEIAVPTLGDLTDIGPAIPDVYWPAVGTAGADLIEAISGMEGSQDPLTIVSSGAVETATGARAIAGDAQLLVYDSSVSGSLRRARIAGTPIDRAAALAEASAYGAFTDPGATLLVTVGRTSGETIRPESAQRAAIRAAGSLGGRTAAALGEVASDTAVTPTTLVDVEADPTRVAALERLLDDEADLVEFATVLEDPTVITGRERASILQLLGNAWLVAPDRWSGAVSAHQAATDTTIDAVSIVPSPDINLLGTVAPLTFSVRNDLPWPASLVLITVPNDPRLRVQDTTEFVAGAAQTTRVDVPVEARVGNGESSLDLHLRSPAMVEIGDAVTVEVTVRTEWETAGIVVVAILVGGFIVLGAIRTIVRLRRRRRPDETDPSHG